MGETHPHKSTPKGGAMTVRRRTVLKGMLGASALVAAPAILRAQSGPMKIGFLTVKTGPLASGGIQMEQGLTLYLKEPNNMLAGRPVQLFTDDTAYGYELNAGFQRAFEDAGGKVVQKLWPPLVSPDYGTYIAQLKQDVDVVFIGFAGSNGFKFFKQYKEYEGKTPILGGMTAI